MATETMILKRKVQIYIDSDIREEREKYYEKLFSWRDIVYRGANLVLSHLYLQERLQDMVYLNEGVRGKLADSKVEDEGLLNCSRMGSGYKLLSKLFLKQVPMAIMACVNQMAYKQFMRERGEYWFGKRSISNYKRTMPMPFSGDMLKLHVDDSGYEYRFRLFKIPFRTYLGSDRTDKRTLLKKAALGKLKVRESSIQLVKGKTYLHIALEFAIRNRDLDRYMIAEASLGIECPLTVTVGKSSYQIGSKEEFMYRRLAIQAAMQRLQRACRFNRGGRGRTKKLQALERFERKEHRYIESKLHLYSRLLIDICLKTGAGNLLLVNQSARQERAKEDDIILRNWSYHGLIEKIKYKARAVGVNLIIE